MMARCLSPVPLPTRCGSPATFLEAVWMVSITMTTVGFGDVVPASLAARVLTLASALAGLILTAIMISIVHKQLELSAAQAAPSPRPPAISPSRLRRGPRRGLADAPRLP